MTANARMQAIVATRYGSPDVLTVATVDRPTPGPKDVLIRVHAASVNYGDLLARDFAHVGPRQFNMPFFFWLPARLAFGLKTPRNPILGAEFSGVVESVGPQVTRFKPGDAVFGYRGPAMKTYAEFVCVGEDSLVTHKPAIVTHEQAAGIAYGALTAIGILKSIPIRPGSKVLVIGASGGIGAAVVQIAKHAGAHVTGVCGTPRLEYVRALGADRVIDYTRQDVTQVGETYDLIVDVLGRGSFRRSQRILAPEGIYLYASFKVKQLLQSLWTSRRGGRQVKCVMSSEVPADLEQVRAWIEDGTLTAIIDRAFPMDQAAAAHRYAESGQKQGSVIIRIAPLDRMPTAAVAPVMAQRQAVPAR